MGEWSLWILVGLSLVGWVFEALRSRRNMQSYRIKMQSLEHELCEALCENEKRQQNRPLMSDEMLAVLRPGDMVLMIPPFDGMSEAHRRMFFRQAEKAAGALKGRGVDLIFAPDFSGRQKVVVVSRGGSQKRHADDDDLACAQAEAERLGLTPLHADYPSDTRLGVEPGDWRLKWPAAKRRIEREMSANA